MYKKDDLDVSKVRILYADTALNLNDSIVISKAATDISIRMFSATGSRNTYMIKNDSGSIFTIYFDAEDVMDTDITYVDIFPYESYLLMDGSPHNWVMLDFHIIWFFGGFPPIIKY